MSRKTRKTLAMRVLEGQGIPYEVVEFPPSIHDAVGVADYAGVPRDHVYKTLVAEADEPGFKPMLVMVGAEDSLDLKKLAKVVGAKKTRMATRADAEKMTRLQAGGISALALLNRGFDVYLDAAAAGLGYIVVSAGQRGLNLRLDPADLIRVTGAEVVDVREGDEPQSGGGGGRRMVVTGSGE